MATVATHVHAEVDERRRSRLFALVDALRPHQWAKNALVFVPLIASHRLLHLDLLRAAVITGAAFSVCASASYILNDILDIRSDRLHPRKRQRPFAAGELSVPFGILAAAVLLAIAAAIAIFGVGIELVVVLATYVAATS